MINNYVKYFIECLFFFVLSVFLLFFIGFAGTLNSVEFAVFALLGLILFIPLCFWVIYGIDKFFSQKPPLENLYEDEYIDIRQHFTPFQLQRIQTCLKQENYQKAGQLFARFFESVYQMKKDDESDASEEQTSADEHSENMSIDGKKPLK